MLEADALVRVTPIWTGEPASVCKFIFEWLDAEILEADDGEQRRAVLSAQIVRDVRPVAADRLQARTLIGVVLDLVHLARNVTGRGWRGHLPVDDRDTGVVVTADRFHGERDHLLQRVLRRRLCLQRPRHLRDRVGETPVRLLFHDRNPRHRLLTLPAHPRAWSTAPSARPEQFERTSTHIRH